MCDREAEAERRKTKQSRENGSEKVLFLFYNFNDHNSSHKTSALLPGLLLGADKRLRACCIMKHTISSVGSVKQQEGCEGIKPAPRCSTLCALLVFCCVINCTQYIC